MTSELLSPPSFVLCSPLLSPELPLGCLLLPPACVVTLFESWVLCGFQEKTFGCLINNPGALMGRIYCFTELSWAPASRNEDS